jgi:hypothetical protein
LSVFIGHLKLRNVRKIQITGGRRKFFVIHKKLKRKTEEIGQIVQKGKCGENMGFA